MVTKCLPQSCHDSTIDCIHINFCAFLSLDISSMERQEAIDLSKTDAICKILKDHFPLQTF